MKSIVLLGFVLVQVGSVYTISQQLLKRAKVVVATSAAAVFLPVQSSWAGMLIFPLPAPLKNNIVLVRSGESYAGKLHYSTVVLCPISPLYTLSLTPRIISTCLKSDSRHEIETNPVKKLQQNNGLTSKGREDMLNVAKRLEEIDFQPSFIWASNTERAYESARVLAEDLKLGQNRIVPEYSFLDARAMGTFEGKNDEETWNEIHKQDELMGVKYKPPPATDGTPSESVSDVLVRANQLVSTIESMYSGENVVIIAPDSENLSVLQAALADENPDASLPKHARFAMKNGTTDIITYPSDANTVPCKCLTGVPHADSHLMSLTSIPHCMIIHYHTYVPHLPL